MNFVLLELEIDMLSLQGVCGVLNFFKFFYFLIINWEKWMREEMECSSSFLKVGIPTIFLPPTACVSGEKEVLVSKQIKHLSST